MAVSPAEANHTTLTITVCTGVQPTAGLPRDAKIRIVDVSGTATDWMDLAGPFDPASQKKFNCQIAGTIKTPAAVELMNPGNQTVMGTLMRALAGCLPVECLAPLQSKNCLRLVTTGEWYVDEVRVGDVVFPCHSWINWKEFECAFAAEPLLPQDTPPALVERRNNQLESRRKIYEFEPYNDLGWPRGNSNPNSQGFRPTPVPYPMRQRTDKASWGLPLFPSSEIIPLDEQFKTTKQWDFTKAQFKAVGQSIASDPKRFIGNIPWTRVEQVEKIYRSRDGLGTKRFKFPRPLVLQDGFDWRSDEEYGRQMVAGVHPTMIRGLTEWPADFPLTTTDIQKRLRKDTTLESELAARRFFIIDYSALEPFVKEIFATRSSKPKTVHHMYAPRCILYLNALDRLLPVAIQLERGKAVYTREADPGEGKWKWLLAKAFVASTDASVHQLWTHFLKCHAACEVYLIAIRRGLSEMHPMFRLLLPHFRYTMNVNKEARRLLIGAPHGLVAGIIENTFAPGPHCIALSSKLYATWRFDEQALPVDLEKRGVLDANVLPSYPFRDDGLLVWNAIHQFVLEYVHLYYGKGAASKPKIDADVELKGFWAEVKHGHPDIKDGWPKLETSEDLAWIATTMIWTASAQHAAVNFPQYDYSAWPLGRPTYTRTAMPEGDVGEKEYMCAMPRPIQSVIVMGTVESLTGRSAEEQYLGEDPVGNKYAQRWIVAPEGDQIYKNFEGRITEVQTLLEQRNLRRVAGGGLAYPYLLPRKRLNEKGDAIEGIPQSVAI